MKRNQFLFTGLLLVAILIVACGSQTPAVNSHSGPVTDFVSLVDALRAQGATIEPSGDISQPFFTVEGQVIQVNSQDVQVFEYADEAAADAEAQLVTPNGSSVGTTMVTWVDSPHFYKTGRLIVLYVGDDVATIDLLETVLGSNSQYGDMVYKSEDTSIRRQRLGHGERPSDEASEVPGEVEQSAPEFGGGS